MTSENPEIRELQMHIIELKQSLGPLILEIQKTSLPAIEANMLLMNSEIKRAVEEVEKLKTKTQHGSHRHMTDVKHLVPEKFSGPKGQTIFRQWTKDVLDLASRYSPRLRSAMAEMQFWKEEIGVKEMSELHQKHGIDMDQDAELTSTLRGFTTGEPRLQMDLMIDSDKYGMEMWRCLNANYGPVTGVSQLDQLSIVNDPGRAKTVTDIIAILNVWEGAVQYLFKQTGRAPVDDAMKRTILLHKVLPEEVGRELRNQASLYGTYEKLRQRVLEIVHERGRNPTAMMNSCENGAMEIENEWVENEEEGCLMRIEVKDGRRVWTRMPFPSKGKGKGKGKGRECYRCGRLGHFGRECSARMHINGGPPKENPRNKSLNAIEEQGQDAGTTLGGLDICMLEDFTKGNITSNGMGLQVQFGLEEHVSRNYESGAAMLAHPSSTELKQPSWMCVPEHWLSKNLRETAVQSAGIQGCSFASEREIGARSWDSQVDNVLQGALTRPTLERKVAEITDAIKELADLKMRGLLDEISPLTSALGTITEVQTDEETEKDDKPLLRFPPGVEHIAAESDTNLAAENSLTLCPVDAMDVDEDWRDMEVTVDSGAANSVLNGDDWPTIPREESEGSRNGRVYLGPGKEKIPNRGQKSMKVKTGGSDVTHGMTFQDAAVRKPLAAVSGMNDKGNLVLFDKKGSYIIPDSSPEVEIIRKLVKQVKNKIEMERRNNVFLMSCKVKTPKMERVFNRPGR